MVTWKGADKPWAEFKDFIFSECKWNLDDSAQGAKQDIKAKNVKIWNKIGPFICEFYKL